MNRIMIDPPTITPAIDDHQSPMTSAATRSAATRIAIPTSNRWDGVRIFQSLPGAGGNGTSALRSELLLKPMKFARLVRQGSSVVSRSVVIAEPATPDGIDLGLAKRVTSHHQADEVGSLRVILVLGSAHLDHTDRINAIDHLADGRERFSIGLTSRFGHVRMMPGVAQRCDSAKLSETPAGPPGTLAMAAPNPACSTRSRPRPKYESVPPGMSSGVSGADEASATAVGTALT